MCCLINVCSGKAMLRLTKMDHDNFSRREIFFCCCFDFDRWNKRKSRHMKTNISPIFAFGCITSSVSRVWVCVDCAFLPIFITAHFGIFFCSLQLNTDYKRIHKKNSFYISSAFSAIY